MPADSSSMSGATSGDPTSASGVTQTGSNSATEGPPPGSSGMGMDTEDASTTSTGGDTGSTTFAESTSTGTTTSTGTDTDTDTGTGSSSSTGPGGEGDLDFELDSISFWQNCQPIVAADPVLVYATVIVTNNTDQTASAIVDSARFIDDSDMTAITFELSPDETGDIAADSETSIDFQKVMDSSSVQNFCDTLTCSAAYRVEIVFEDGLGEEVLVSDEESLSCPE